MLYILYNVFIQLDMQLYNIYMLYIHTHLIASVYLCNIKPLYVHKVLILSIYMKFIYKDNKDKVYIHIYIFKYKDKFLYNI